MPIGPYSPCPGGTGNKIKFCCPELLGELQKIERMLEGEQYLACLRHIEHLEKTHPDKACLLANKILLLRILDNVDEARTTAATFLEKHPENPIARAESAILAAVSGDSRRAMDLILGAVAASKGQMHGRVYNAMSALSRVLAAGGEFLAARAMATLQLNIQEQDRRPMALLVDLHASPSVPLLLKDERILRSCPDHVPWKAEFDEASSLALQARWAEAAERLAKLAERVDAEPVIWRNLATIRGWLADTPGCVQALRKLATLDVPLEDAVEAEALALLLCDDPLGDQVDVLTLRYPVDDVEQLEAALLSAPQTVQMRADPASLADDDTPPPKGVFLLFDRESPRPFGGAFSCPTDGKATESTAETTPRMLCQALLYGKQTDRQAELEVIDVVAYQLDHVKALLAEVAGDPLGGEPEQEATGRVSATQERFTCNWRLPAGVSREDFQRLSDQYIDNTVLETWPQSPLGLLDGKCPQEAADQQAYRVRLLAAIMVLESWLGQNGSGFDFNRLRSRLGLPVLEPIDPQQTPLYDLPMVRWSRVEVDKLPDESLLDGYRLAMAYGARAAMPSFARALVERSSLAGREERLMAFEMMARTADDSDQALKYLEDGRKEAGQAGGSCAHWDLLELPFRLERGEGPEASRLLEHIQSRHINEPGVARALTDLLVQCGVLRPDGTPAVPPGAPTADDPSLVIPGQSTAEPGKLWTPESQKPTGDKPKIWTPGMD